MEFYALRFSSGVKRDICRIYQGLGRITFHQGGQNDKPHRGSQGLLQPRSQGFSLGTRLALLQTDVVTDTYSIACQHFTADFTVKKYTSEMVLKFKTEGVMRNVS